jgi:regulatory protein
MAADELYKTLLNRSMALCAGREMCLSDMTLKLKSWGADEKVSARILKQLTSEKFIDEERFALAFTKDKFRNNKWGKVKIAHGLKLKKIPGELIRLSLDAIDEETYLELIRNVMEAHRKKIKARNQYDLKGKMLRFGLSKGFESHLLYELLNNDLR